MIKKMCPVCDLPVNAGNYCPRCRRVIRKPYTQNVDYYLNERHPVHEAECDFHNPYLEADHHGESSRPAGAVPGKILRAEILQSEILQVERFRAGRGRIRHQAQEPFMEAGRRERRSRQDGRHRWAR